MWLQLAAVLVALAAGDFFLVLIGVESLFVFRVNGCPADKGEIMNIGIIGCGNIASSLHECLDDINVFAVFDRHIDRAERVARILDAKATDCFERFMEYDLDLVIEVASVEAVVKYAQAVLSKGCEFIVLSSGALSDTGFRKELEGLAEQKRVKIHIPSGAIFGLDNAGIGKIGGLEHVRLRTLKPARSFGLSIEERVCIFQGGAYECIKRFPKNTNVAVSLSLATGMEAEVEVWADPKAETISHTIVMEGEFGSVEITISNKSSPKNPSTSHLAVMSVCALLSSMQRSIQVGS